MIYPTRLVNGKFVVWIESSVIRPDGCNQQGVGVTTKIPITAADLLNDRALPAFEIPGLSVPRILTDRGIEFCRRPDSHDYQLYLAINDIEHTKTKGNRLVN